jgi:hypothetical protein
MHGFNCRPRRHHPQQYEDMSLEAANNLGLWKFENCPNLANAHVGCNIHARMNVDRLHLPFKGIFNDYTWELMVDFLKDLSRAEKALELIDENFFALPHFSDISQLGDKLT